MRTNKRQISLSSIKDSFHQSGLVDWHLSPRLSNDDSHEEGDSDAAVMTAPPEFKRPPMYAVVLMNDDYTPMDFVIEILQQYFAMNLDQATQVMLTVDYEVKCYCKRILDNALKPQTNQVNTSFILILSF